MILGRLMILGRSSSRVALKMVSFKKFKSILNDSSGILVHFYTIKGLKVKIEKKKKKGRKKEIGKVRACH